MYVAVTAPGPFQRCDGETRADFRRLARTTAEGRFDLVVAGGLFDSLPDRWAVATLRAVERMLNPGGRLIFSNIAAGNPFRAWLEYLAEWQLIERDQEALELLLSESGFPTDGAHIFRDSSDLAFMVEVQRKKEKREREKGKALFP
jgi:SAM-dependent methyltransferase